MRWVARKMIPLLPSLVVAACAARPETPPVMRELDEVRQAPALRDAETWAPQAHAHASQLSEQARRELEQGDPDSAEILGEHALAANEHAWVLARLARAERRHASAELELRELTQALAALTAQQQRLGAEIAGVELQSQAARAAAPGPRAAAAEQVASRGRAAAALAVQGRLLCVGARLLGQHEQLSATVARLDELERRLGEGKGAELFDEAVELRARCLELITSVRRSAAASSAAASSAAPSSAAPSASAAATAQVRPIPADLLLSKLSAMGVQPSRDERGVAVTLRGVFGERGAVLASARAKLEKLASVSKAHPEFPLMLVAHGPAAEPRGSAERKLAALSDELRGLGVEAIEAVDAGSHQPLLPPDLPHAPERNARLELVFIAPGL